MIYKWVPLDPELNVGFYFAEYDLETFDGDYVATVGLDWNMVSYEVIDTCWGGVKNELKGLFANSPSLEVAIRRHIKNPELVNVEF